MIRQFLLISVFAVGAALLPPSHLALAAHDAAHEEVASAALAPAPKKEISEEKKTEDKIEEKAGETKVSAESTSPPPPVKIPAALIRANYIGDEKSYVTKYEDTLVQLARDNDIGFVELRSANPDVDPWLPGEGVKLTLPTRHLIPDADRRGVIINLPEMRLYYFGAGNATPVTYPIGIGREGLKTPVGQTYVRMKKAGPTWRPTPRMRLEDPTLPVEVPPGPENPMGTHAMYLGWPEYAIHGTNKPFGIGRRSSSGCIRMYPEDIIRLFPAVPEHETVTVVDQPVKAAWIGEKLYIEAHPTVAQANKMEEDGGLPTYEIGDADMKRIMKAAGPHVASLDWPLIRKVVRERRGYPIAIGHKVEGVADAKPDVPVLTKVSADAPAVKSEPKPKTVKKAEKKEEKAQVAKEPEKSLFPWLQKKTPLTEKSADEKKAEKESPEKKK